MDLVLNNLQRLICHKNQPTNRTPVQNIWVIYMNKGSIPALTKKIQILSALLTINTIFMKDNI